MPNVRFGQKRTWKRLRPMSALPPIADIAEGDRHVRFVPKADILRCSKQPSIRSPRRRGRSGTLRPKASAVLRLITRSNFVACITGESLGLSPLRIRSAICPLGEIPRADWRRKRTRGAEDKEHAMADAPTNSRHANRSSPMPWRHVPCEGA